MERLTNIQANPIECIDCPVYPDCYGDLSCNAVYDCLERLRAYEDTDLTPEQILEKLEELEQLKKQLPAFGIGDTAYLVDFDTGVIDKSVVNGIISRIEGEVVEFEYDSDLLELHSNDIGECVFLSEPEAQEALERMVKK